MRGVYDSYFPSPLIRGEATFPQVSEAGFASTVGFHDIWRITDTMSAMMRVPSLSRVRLHSSANVTPP